MYGHTNSKSRDQPGKIKVANPARGQLNGGNKYLLPPFAPENELGLTRWVRPSRPASAYSLSSLRLNMVLTHGVPPNFGGGVHLSMPSNAFGSVPSLSGHAIAYPWRSLPRVRRHRASNPQGSSCSGWCLCRSP